MTKKTELEAVILAGGQSRRMGTDKAKLRLGRRTLLGHTKVLAKSLGLPARVVARDLRPNAGPLGGIETALETTQAARVLFLSCDMPLLQPALVQQILAVDAPAVFASREGVVGFPFCLAADLLPKVAAQLDAGERSLQKFSRAIRARRPRIAKANWPQLANVNTPADLARAAASLP